MAKARLNHLIVAAISRSIVAKSTIKILLSSLAISLCVSMIAVYFIEQYQKTQIEDSIKQLASTVESSARIAAFTNDITLSNEVAFGLLTNKTVKKVIIKSLTTENKWLVLSNLPATVSIDSSESKPYTKKLYSPFNKTEQVGTLDIWLAPDIVKQQAISYAKLSTLTLFIILLGITAVLIGVIYYSITKPIKSISDEIHAANLTTSTTFTTLSTPKHNKHDEIGRLVQDTNHLIKQLKNLADSEHKLRVRQEQSEQQLRMIFEKAGTGIVLMSNDLQLLSWNPAFVNMLGIQNALQVPDEKFYLNQIIANRSPLLSNSLLINRGLENLRTRQEAVSFVVELQQNQVKKSHKKHSWLEITLLAVDAQHIQGILNDVTSHKLAEIAALKQSEHDVLTNLYNRRGFEPRLNQLIKQEKNNEHIALLLIDLDGFKYVNDHFGHAAGDAVLIEVSRRLERTIRDDDLVARLGGDEFVVVLSHVKTYAKAGIVANKIIKSLSMPIPFENETLVIGASIGVVVHDQGNVNAATLLKQADESMYVAKQAGKSRFHLFNPSA